MGECLAASPRRPETAPPANRPGHHAASPRYWSDQQGVDLCAKTNEIAFACEPTRHDEGLIEATGFACTASFSRWHKTSRASPILRDIDFARYSSLRHWKSTDEKTRKFLIEQEILMTLSESVASMPRWTLACGPVAPLVPITSKPRRARSYAAPMGDIAAHHNR
ncbi:hypothetical protein [Sphingobium sp. B10D3B]|uniref:hypothetical protein n=1 Tax=Sphingobium sp. B10D3B TaxID=2940572 RepID=UPI00160E387C|nr:hypothetical protein [Sphingobium sp. B10D3B]